MRLKDLRHSCVDDENVFGINGDRSFEDYLLNWIDGGEEFIYEFKEIEEVRITITLKSILNILIDDMYEDEPVYMEDEIADKLISNPDDLDVIWKVINKYTSDHFTGILKEIIGWELDKVTEDKIKWN